MTKACPNFQLKFSEGFNRSNRRLMYFVFLGLLLTFFPLANGSNFLGLTLTNFQNNAHVLFLVLSTVSFLALLPHLIENLVVLKGYNLAEAEERKQIKSRIDTATTIVGKIYENINQFEGRIKTSHSHASKNREDLKEKVELLNETVDRLADSPVEPEILEENRRALNLSLGLLERPQENFAFVEVKFTKDHFLQILGQDLSEVTKFLQVVRPPKNLWTSIRLYTDFFSGTASFGLLVLLHIFPTLRNQLSNLLFH